MTEAKAKTVTKEPEVSKLQKELNEVVAKMKVLPFLSEEYIDLDHDMRAIMQRQIWAGER